MSVQKVATGSIDVSTVDGYKIVTITDSPRPAITTGFSNVARQILQGFHDSGLKVFSFGSMDGGHDLNKDLPYVFQPTVEEFDDMGHRTVGLFLTEVQPDVVFMLYDPGNVDIFSQIVLKMQESGLIKKCPIVAYMPIEGTPVPLSTYVTIRRILEHNGRVVLYSPGMVDIVVKQYPDLGGKLDYAYHGLDHVNFEPRDVSGYKKVLGWANKFVVGSVGVNKRTKGLDTIIYTARCLKDLKQHQDILFYLHTSADQPTMWGYNLKDLADIYDVNDIIVFKPEKNDGYGGNIKGIDSETINVNNKHLLASLGFIDRINLFDCYLDLSQVEGWGLPQMEAMRCGIPTISVHDRSIRDEVYQGGVMWLDPEPYRMWTTWHTGVKLVLVDPAKAAEAIIEMKKADPAIRKFWSERALDIASRYNWQPTKDKFVRIVNEVIKNYEYTT